MLALQSISFLFLTAIRVAIVARAVILGTLTSSLLWIALIF